MAVTVTHPERVVFPADGITKGQIVDYYERVAPVALPHWRGRPLTLFRVQESIDKGGFMQKQAPKGRPDWLPVVTVPKERGEVTHPLAESVDDVVWLANHGMVTPHVWLSRADRPHNPDRVVIDLDPSSDALSVLRDAARRVAAAFEHVGLVPFLSSTGSRGYHVTAPLDRSATTEEVRDFAAALASAVESDDPDNLTTAFSKADRGGRLYLDVARNGYAQTVVAPYGVRTRAGAPVSVPLEWDELARVVPDQFTIGNLFRRLAQKPDPWADIEAAARPLPPPPST